MRSSACFCSWRSINSARTEAESWCRRLDRATSQSVLRLAVCLARLWRSNEEQGLASDLRMNPEATLCPSDKVRWDDQVASGYGAVVRSRALDYFREGSSLGLT